MKTNYTINNEEILDTDEYFFWLGQVSSFICKFGPNSIYAKRNFLSSSNKDFTILHYLKKYLPLVDYSSLTNSTIENFELTLCKVLAYNDTKNIISNFNSCSFILGFHSKSLF